MYKIKRFSIQSGKPSKSVGIAGEFKNKAIKYAPVGALIGAGYGAISEDEGVIKSSIKGAGIGILLAALDTALSYFRRKNVKKSTPDEVISLMKDDSPISSNDYTINSDPYSSKVSVSIAGGIMVMYLNNLTEEEITSISNELDKRCKEDRYSTYKSEITEPGYLVTVVLSSVRSVSSLLTYIINDLGIKINIVSESKSKKFSIFNFKEKNKTKYGIPLDIDELPRTLIENNKVIKNLKKVDPDVVNKAINDLSIDPIIEKYKISDHE